MELEVTNMKNKGFTLIEVIVSLAIFSLIILSMTTIAVSVIKSQRKVFVVKGAQEAGRYLLESMTKEIRMSEINSSAGSGLTTLNITNAEGKTLNYRFINASGELRRDGKTISPDDTEVTGSFYVRKNDFPRRAMVTIVMQAKSTGPKVEEQTEIYLQSTVASRGY